VNGLPAVQVTLRRAEPEDARRLLAWLEDPEVTRWLLAPEYWRAVAEAHPAPPADEPQPHAVYAVDVLGEGCVGIGILVEAHGWGPEPELGIVIGRRDLWDRGIGTAAVRRMLAIASDYGWTAVRLATLADNARAIRCYQKCGFKITGTEPYSRALDTVEMVRMSIDLAGRPRHSHAPDSD